MGSSKYEQIKRKNLMFIIVRKNFEANTYFEIIPSFHTVLGNCLPVEAFRPYCFCQFHLVPPRLILLHRPLLVHLKVDNKLTNEPILNS